MSNEPYNKEEKTVDTRNRRDSIAGVGTGLVAIGAVCLVIALATSFVSQLQPLQGAGQIVFLIFGLLLLLLGAFITTMSRLYHRTTANMAFVRTGMGGTREVIDGGAIVIPGIHEVVEVSLETMRLDVDREGVEALITGDNLRADIKAEFYIKVEKTPEAVKNAATSLGFKSTSPDIVKDLVYQKLVSALRTVAATRKLAELHTKRNEFAQEVQDNLRQDLEHNGLTLESVTISRLDQTPPNALRAEDNVFDAQGLQRIAEITTAARIETNKLQTAADAEVEQQNVQRDKQVYELHVSRQAAEAGRDRQIAIAKAEAEREAATFAAEQKRQIGVAQTESERAVQVAKVSQEQEVQVAQQQRDQAVQTAEILRQQAVEVASRDSQIAIASREKERAAAEAARLLAESEREKAAQQVKTVEATQAAERQSATQVIGAKAQAEQQRVQQQTNADIQAYAKVREAEAIKDAAQRQAEAQMAASAGEAKAKMTRAEAEANAQLLQAKASAEAQQLTAQGLRANEMVPVEVDRQRVEVEQARVEVNRQDLENKAKYETIARDLQTDLATIEAQRALGIAFAQAMGEALGKASIQIYGDGSTLTQINEAFARGQRLAQIGSGLMSGLSDDAKQLAGTVLGGVATSVVDKVLNNSKEEEETK